MELSKSFLLVIVFSYFTHAARRLVHNFDLNLPSNSEDTYAETNEENIVNHGTSSSHSDTSGTNYLSDNKLRDPKNHPIHWKPYVPADITLAKMETLRTKENYLRSKEESFHFWNFSQFSHHDLLAMCTKVWVTLKVEGIILKGDPIPVCPIAKKATITSRTYGNLSYTAFYRFAGTEDHNSFYYMDLLRCNCKYVRAEDRRAAHSSKRFFLVHEILPKQYLIFSPINPHLIRRIAPAQIHLVDFYDEL